MSCFHDIHYLGFGGVRMGMRVLATPKGLDIHLFFHHSLLITVGFAGVIKAFIGYNHFSANIIRKLLQSCSQ